MDFYFANVDGLQIRNWLSNDLGLNNDDFYLTFQGKLVYSDTFVDNGTVHVHPSVRGGKGGFGSLLRAIGAQIKKTSNNEACRDLNGRRLRDINEEQRLRTWIDQRAEREKEAKERKQKKLEKLCEPTKHEFNDEEYNKERSLLPEIVEDAVLQGLQATASSSTKRKAEQRDAVNRKKPKLWIDCELEYDISDDDDDDDYYISEPEENSCKKTEDTKASATISNSNNNCKTNEVTPEDSSLCFEINNIEESIICGKKPE